MVKRESELEMDTIPNTPSDTKTNQNSKPSKTEQEIKKDEPPPLPPSPPQTKKQNSESNEMDDFTVLPLTSENSQDVWVIDKEKQKQKTLSVTRFWNFPILTSHRIRGRYVK